MLTEEEVLFEYLFFHENKIKVMVKRGADLVRLVFWGTGDTAKKYISQIKELSDQFKVVAFTDSNQKETKEEVWEGYPLISPKMISNLSIDYICILSIWEWEIRKKIYDEKLFDLSKIVSFHEICMMDSFGIDIDSCYKKVLKSIHPLQLYSAEMWRVYEYLKKKYSYVLCDNTYWNVDLKKKIFLEAHIKPIWILWLQGIDQAPEVVKVCIHSLEKALGKEECIYLLDKNNLFDYINLPDYIMQKWEDGIIDNTKFANLVRLRLLNVYGGVWIDATVYFTGDKLPEYIKNSKMFMFSIWENWRKCERPAIAANWLISAQPATKVLIVLEALHYEYWKRENKIINYYFFHIFLTMVAECFQNEWDQMEVILRDPSQLLSSELYHEYNDIRFKHIKQMTDIHKLSYKLFDKMGKKDNFWAKICEIDREENS